MTIVQRGLFTVITLFSAPGYSNEGRAAPSYPLDQLIHHSSSILLVQISGIHTNKNVGGSRFVLTASVEKVIASNDLIQKGAVINMISNDVIVGQDTRMLIMSTRLPVFAQTTSRYLVFLQSARLPNVFCFTTEILGNFNGAGYSTMLVPAKPQLLDGFEVYNNTPGILDLTFTLNLEGSDFVHDSHAFNILRSIQKNPDGETGMQELAKFVEGRQGDKKDAQGVSNAGAESPKLRGTHAEMENNVHTNIFDTDPPTAKP